MKINLLFFNKFFLFTMFGLLLSACSSNDFSDLDEKIAEIKARPKGQVAPLPPVKITEPFSFVLDNSRDPFKPMEKDPSAENEEEHDNGIKPDPNRVKEDLESYPLDSLKMVGTLKRDATLWALVKADSGTVYRIKVGNYMGLNDGEIIGITNDEIKLMEIIPEKNPDSEKPRWNKQPTSLKLVATE